MITMQLGLKRFFHDLTRHRERFRQFLGIVFILLLTIVGIPANMWLYVAGVIFIVVGSGIRLWASGHIKKDQVLAVNGPYAYVRHPLYVGNLTLLFGFCLASGLWWSAPVLILFALGLYPPAIRQEDAKLRQRFMERWEAWSQETSALIPRLTPYRSTEAGGWSFKQSLRENGEPIIVLFLIVCLYFLYSRIL